jgi:hypothetical protein
MRLTNWLLGIVLGALMGGLALEVGVLDLLLAAPVFVWAAREASRPTGLAGVFIGAGVGQIGLLALAGARCAGANQAGAGFVETCYMPDQTPYLVVAVLLAVIGLALTVFVIFRRRSVAG